MTSPERDESNARRLERIRLSHYRSQRAGLVADERLRVVAQDFDRTSRLVEASRPVLRRLTDALDGLMAGGLLTDRQGTVVDRYFGDDRMARAADGLGAVVGASFNEELTGTNAISLPLETKSSILVRADEHYLDDLKAYTCYGVPIVNPVTNRIEGVVDLMVEDAVTPGLMAGLLDRAADEITGRMLEDYDPDLVMSVAAFRKLCGRTSDGITLIARDFIVHNLRAADMVTGDDADILRELAGRLGPESAEDVQLSSGVDVTVTKAQSAAEGSVLLRIADGNRHRTPIPRKATVSTPRVTAIDRRADALANSSESVFIVGEPGSGRTRAALRVAGSALVRLVDASLDDPALTKDLLRAQMEVGDRSATTVVIEHAHLLDSEVCQAVVALMRSRARVRLVATAIPSYADRPEVEYLASTCSSWIEIPPLRNRINEFGLVVDQIVDDISEAHEIPTERRPNVTRPTIQHLKALPWPGNVAELHAMLTATLKHRSVGDIVISDLPERYRRATGTRTNLTPLEQAERDLIIEALATNHGNKVQTAQLLGISRSKLYDRIRHFQIEIH